MKNTPSDSPNHDLLCKNMKIFKQSLRTLIREAKRIHYDSEFIKFSGDCKKTWNNISEILNKNNSKKSKFPEHFKLNLDYSINENGIKSTETVSINISDKKTRADQFNVYFF